MKMLAIITIIFVAVIIIAKMPIAKLSVHQMFPPWAHGSTIFSGLPYS